MGRRSVEAWRALFEAHAQSGLTASAFCLERGLCPKYFSLRKKLRKNSLAQRADVSAPSTFVRVEAAEAPSHEVHEACVRLRLGRCEWFFRGFAVGDLIRLAQALA